MSLRLSGRASLLAAIVALAACGSSGQSSDGGPGDAPAEVPPLCGSAACSGDQLCVIQQNCTGLACTPPPATGGCPTGSTATSTCPDTGQPGCMENCPPATFSCQARPAECATLSCSCATALCAPAECIETMGNRVACAVQ